MRTFEHKGNHFLQIKDHNFHVLNKFGNDYIQCTTNSSSGIIKEYLPKELGLSKARYNGQMIFTLYKKNLFSYKSKSKSLGTMMFVALSEEGAKYLLYRWILNEQVGLDDTQENINIVADILKQKINNVYGKIKDQKLYAVNINMNDWRMNSLLDDITTKIENKNN